MGWHRLRIGIAFTAAMMGANGQWLNYPIPGTPRTKDGKPNLSAPAPRSSNGKPDLSGVWMVEPPTPAEMERKIGDVATFTVPGDDPSTFSPYFFNILADFKREEAPCGQKRPRRFWRVREILARFTHLPIACRWASPAPN